MINHFFFFYVGKMRKGIARDLGRSQSSSNVMFSRHWNSTYATLIAEV